jgi:hypothetical protein
VDDFALTETDSVSSIEDFVLTNLPEKTSLHENYPDPFNPTTKIPFDLHKTSAGSMVIYDMLGHRIRSLWNGTRPAGRYIEIWDGTNSDGINVASGIYFYVLKVEGMVAAKKMILLK